MEKQNLVTKDIFADFAVKQELKIIFIKSTNASNSVDDDTSNGNITAF